MKRLTLVLSMMVAFALLFVAFEGAALEAENIKDIRGSTETLWQFLARFPSSFEAQVFYGLVLSAAIGLLGSWLWKWSQGTAQGLQHFTPRYIVGQILWVIGGSVTTISTVGFQTDSGEFFGWMSIIVTGGLMGFSGEIKTERKQWSPRERMIKRDLDVKP